MKVIVNRKELVRTLKTLKELAKDDDRLKDIVALVASEGTLTLFSGVGTAFMVVSIPAQVKEEGSCQVSYRLYDLAKLAKDDELTLSFNKTLSVSGSSKFKASLTQNVSFAIPYDRIIGMADGGTQLELELNAEELMYLVDVSKALPPVKEFYYVIIENSEEGLHGAVQPSEYGQVESYPMMGEGAEVTYKLNSLQLKIALTFCGTSARVGELMSAPGFCMISDPENPSWYVLIGQVRETTETNEPNN